MKILYVGFYNFSSKTAPVQRVASTTRLLQILGHTVIHLSNGEEKNGSIDLDGCRHYVFPNANTGKMRFRKIFTAYDVKKVIAQEKNIDVVILYNYHSISMYAILKYCKRYHVKVLGDTTEWYQYYTIKEKITKGLNVFLRMRIMQTKLDGLIVISQFMKEFYEKYHNPVALIPPLIDYDDSKWVSSIAEISDIPKIVTIATGDKHKDDLAAVIKLLYLVKIEYQDIAFHLHIIGMTEEEYVDKFDKDGIPETLKNKITFHGRLPHQKVIEYEKSAWFTMFIREQNLANNAGFPSKVAESLACGTPVIANNTSNLADCIKNDINGYILRCDIKEQVDILHHALTLSRTAIEKMHENCRADQTFDYLNYQSEIQKVLPNRS